MDTTTTYGLLCLLPVVIVITTAVITKRAIEPLLVGIAAGYIILDKQYFVVSMLDSFMLEMGESAYYILVFCLCGAFIRLLEGANAVSGFTRLGMKFANTKKKSALLMWVMGICLFLDEYFSVLSTGIANRQIADKNGMSREMFAFSINTTAVSACILVPLSLWGIFMTGQIEATLGLAEGEGFSEIVKSIPFVFFGWIAVVMVLLYQMRIVKPYGGMKKAELRAEQEGLVLPPDLADTSEAPSLKEEAGVWNFLIPMLALLLVTLITKSLLYGLITGLAACFVLYIPQKLMKITEAFDSVYEGFKDMIVVTIIVVCAFVLQNANEELGLAQFVTDAFMEVISAPLLPVIAFVMLWILGFATGCFWGMAAVCFPIMIPMAEMMDVNIYLTIGALISGAGAGSASCFYGDSVTLACGTAKIRNADFFQTGLPMLALPLGLTIIAYIIAGFIFA